VQVVKLVVGPTPYTRLANANGTGSNYEDHIDIRFCHAISWFINFNSITTETGWVTESCQIGLDEEGKCESGGKSQIAQETNCD
jgi:hypothetical protein